MKNYKITVNGHIYEVTVEEQNGAAAVSSVHQIPAAPVPAPVAARQPAAAPVQTAAAGSVKIEAPMVGKILKVAASVGQQVKKGDVMFILEAMKMENDIVAAEDGTVASVCCSQGDSVEAGDVLATLS